MSILQGLLKGTGDPQKDQVLSQGLLHMGLSLLGSKGNFGNALGNAGLAGLQGASQYHERMQRDKRLGMQDQLSQIQLQQALRQQQLAELPKQFMRSPESQALAGGGGPTVENAQKIGDKPGFDMQGYLTALEGMDPLMAMEMRQKLGPKPSDFKTVGGSLVQITPDGKVSEAYRAPEKAAPPSSLGKLLEEMNGLPANDPRRGVYMDAIKKATTHQPGVSVSYGAPVAGVDAEGKPVFFQPSKGGGSPAIIPGVAPPAKPDRVMTEAQAKAATFKSQMETAEKELSKTPIDMNSLWSQVDVKMAGGLTNLAASPAAQRARQAQEQWAESFLRFKTGAASTKDEVLANVRTFFPQPGDSKAVVEQKARARKQAVHDIGLAASGKPPPQDAAASAPAASAPSGVIDFGSLK